MVCSWEGVRCRREMNEEDCYMLRDAFYYLFVFIVSLYFQELDYIYNFHLPPVSKSLSLHRCQTGPRPPPHYRTQLLIIFWWWAQCRVDIEEEPHKVSFSNPTKYPLNLTLFPLRETRPWSVELTVINGRTFFSFRMSIYKSSSWTSGGKLSWNILHH